MLCTKFALWKSHIILSLVHCSGSHKAFDWILTLRRKRRRMLGRWRLMAFLRWRRPVLWRRRLPRPSVERHDHIDWGDGAMRQEVCQVSWWCNNYNFYAQAYLYYEDDTFFYCKLPFPTDLHFAEQHSPQLSSFPEDPPTFSEEPHSQPMSLPQSTLYGSRGIPLHHPRESSGPAIRIDLSQFQLGVGLTPCSLDTLGIVPARSLIRGKFGSLSSLVNPRSFRGTFKQHYPPSSTSSHSQPVIIRGIIPGSPVAVTRDLHEGMHAALALVLKARCLDGWLCFLR